jgi:hypothetical protein
LIGCQLSSVAWKNIPSSDAYGTLSSDAVIDDFTPSGILVDASKGSMKLMIPRGSRHNKLYIKKTDKSAHTVTIVSADLHDGIIINFRSNCVKLFRHEGKYYIKYKY